MWNLAREILTSDAGSLGFVIACVLLGAYCMVKIGSWLEKMKGFDKLEESLSKIKEEIIAIKGFIQLYERKNSSLAEAQSPINLNDKGRKVSEEMSAQKIVDNNWIEISKKINKGLPKDCNSYEIQEICFDIASDYSTVFSKSEMTKIKDVAYIHGFNLADFDILFGILIRNKYFTEQGMNINEVDTHDPNKAKKT